MQSLQLQAGVDGPRLADFLPFAVQTKVPALDHRGLVAICGEQERDSVIGCITSRSGKQREVVFEQLFPGLLKNIKIQ